MISAASVSLHVNIPRFPFFPLLFSPLLLRSLSYRCGVKTTYLKSALPGEKMRPSFNSRGMPSSFVTSPDVSLRREKCIPAKIMKPLFHFFSLHFISPPPTAAPSHFEIRTSLHHIPGGASQRAVPARTTIHIQFSKVLRREVGIVGAFIRIFKALIEDFIGLKRRSWRNQKLMDSLNGFASYVPDFPSIFWRLVFLYGQRESAEKERRKEVTGIPFSWKLLLLNFPISSKLWDY